MAQKLYLYNVYNVRQYSLSEYEYKYEYQYQVLQSCMNWDLRMGMITGKKIRKSRSVHAGLAPAYETPPPSLLNTVETVCKAELF